MEHERGLQPEHEERAALTPEQLEEMREFVTGPLRGYQNKGPHEALFRKAGIDPEGEMAESIQLCADRDNIRALPVGKQHKLYQAIQRLKKLFEIGAGEGN